MRDDHMVVRILIASLKTVTRVVIWLLGAVLTLLTVVPVVLILLALTLAHLVGRVFSVFSGKNRVKQE